jgi:phosphoribosylformylglycinamidine synthase
LGANYDLSPLITEGGVQNDFVQILFAENIGLVLQADAEIESEFKNKGIELFKIGEVVEGNTVSIKHNSDELKLNISELRDVWFKTSFLLDRRQSKNQRAEARYENYKNQPLKYTFPLNFGKTKSPRILLSVISSTTSIHELLTACGIIYDVVIYHIDIRHL